MYLHRLRIALGTEGLETQQRSLGKSRVLARPSYANCPSFSPRPYLCLAPLREFRTPVSTSERTNVQRFSSRWVPEHMEGALEQAHSPQVEWYGFMFSHLEVPTCDYQYATCPPGRMRIYLWAVSV